MNLLDITHDFLKHSTPGKGHIYIEEGLDFTTHQKEIETARWLLANFGGEITVLNERRTYNVKYPDYNWNGKFWELKYTSSLTSLDRAVRKAIAQITKNPGGIIINVDNIYEERIKGALIKRLNMTNINNIIIIVKRKNTIHNIYKYKK